MANHKHIKECKPGIDYVGCKCWCHNRMEKVLGKEK